jgi:hypothetical protein
VQQPIPQPRPVATILDGGWLTQERLAHGARLALVTLRRWMLSDILSIFLATRLAFLLLTYFGLALFHDPALVGQERLGFSGHLLDAWFYRDSQWFLTIVNQGYQYNGPGRESAVAFFPVFPLLVKALHMLTAIDAGICAMVVANVSFLGGMIFLHRLCAREFGPETARRAVFYMAIFPTSFFFFAP